MTMTINSEVSAFGIQQDFNIFTFEPFTNEKGLTEQMQVAMFGDLSEEGNSPSGNGKRLIWDQVIGWQFSQFGLSAILRGRQAAQAWLSVLCIDRGVGVHV
jgi:hypothetical protein